MLSHAFAQCSPTTHDAWEMMEALQSCALPAPWKAALRRRRLGTIGMEEELCRRGRKFLHDRSELGRIAKRCGVGWPSGDASGPRALVLGWNLRSLLLDQGYDTSEADRIGRTVAGLVLPPPTQGGWTRRFIDAPPPEVPHGLVFSGRTHLASSSGPAQVLLALPAGDWSLVAVAPRSDAEDAPLVVLPFLRAENLRVAVQITPTATGYRVAFGRRGDVLETPDAPTAVRVARGWLDWSQEYGREVLPDRLWITPTGTVDQVAQLLSACLEEDAARFDGVVIAARADLLDWPVFLDAHGLDATGPDPTE